MRITKEQISKLSKEDQEEYRRRMKETEDTFEVLPLTRMYIKWTICLFGFTLIIMPLWKIAFGNRVFVDITLALLSALKVMGLAIGIALVADCIDLIFFIKKRDKIRSEYFNFKIEVKNERRKK